MIAIKLSAPLNPPLSWSSVSGAQRKPICVR